MALISPADRRYVIGTVDNGNYKLLGNASKSQTGAWSVSFAPDDFFEGEFLITAREQQKGAADDAAGYGLVAYIRVQLNGAAADYELVADPINGHATVLVPASGLTVAVAVTCTAGTCTMYSTPLDGVVGPAFRTGGAL